MERIEFFLGADGHIWYRNEDVCRRLVPSDTEIVEWMLGEISRLYPAAATRLQQMFERSQPNRRFYRFKIVERFIRCNMSADDGLRYDIDGGRMNLEQVVCPLRGECKLEGVVCRPCPDSAMSSTEQDVARLYADGYSIQEIADRLHKSMSTVNNQIWQMTRRFGLKHRRELARVAHDYRLI